MARLRGLYARRNADSFIGDDEQIPHRPSSYRPVTALVGPSPWVTPRRSGYRQSDSIICWCSTHSLVHPLTRRTAHHCLALFTWWIVPSFFMWVLLSVSRLLQEAKVAPRVCLSAFGKREVPLQRRGGSSSECRVIDKRLKGISSRRNADSFIGDDEQIPHRPSSYHPVAALVGPSPWVTPRRSGYRQSDSIICWCLTRFTASFLIVPP